MSDAPILSTLNHVTDLTGADDFTKKHTPHIETQDEDGKTRITATVGHYVAHPNQPDHFIQWIEILVGDSPVIRFDLSPVATDPSVSVVVNLDPGTTLRVVASCNLHGLWVAETTL